MPKAQSLNPPQKTLNTDSALTSWGCQINAENWQIWPLERILALPDPSGLPT